jgi:hypothetical protein
MTTDNKYFLVEHNILPGKEEAYRAYLTKINNEVTLEEKRATDIANERLGFHTSLCIPINDKLIYCVWQTRSDRLCTDLLNFLNTDSSKYTPVNLMESKLREIDTKSPSFVHSGYDAFDFSAVRAREDKVLKDKKSISETVVDAAKELTGVDQVREKVDYL